MGNFKREVDNGIIRNGGLKGFIISINEQLANLTNVYENNYQHGASHNINQIEYWCKVLRCLDKHYKEEFKKVVGKNYTD